MELAILAVCFFSGKPGLTKTKCAGPKPVELEGRLPNWIRLRMREVYMRTLVIGLVIAIVCMTTYFVQTMEHIW